MALILQSQAQDGISLGPKQSKGRHVSSPGSHCMHLHYMSLPVCHETGGLPRPPKEDGRVGISLIATSNSHKAETSWPSLVVPLVGLYCTVDSVLSHLSSTTFR